MSPNKDREHFRQLQQGFEFDLEFKSVLETD